MYEKKRRNLSSNKIAKYSINTGIKYCLFAQVTNISQLNSLVSHQLKPQTSHNGLPHLQVALTYVWLSTQRMYQKRCFQFSQPFASCYQIIYSKHLRDHKLILMLSKFWFFVLINTILYCLMLMLYALNIVQMVPQITQTSKNKISE